MNIGRKIYITKGGAFFTDIKKIKDFKINNRSLVDVTEMGSITKIRYMQHKNATCYIQRLDANNYIDLQTGEVKEVKHIDSRADDKLSVAKSLERLRDYLNTNITDVTKCRWVTLTYAENMTDTLRLYKDFKTFWKRFLYYCKKNDFGKPDYIIACEPQGRGAWHIHAVFIFSNTAPFISNCDLRAIWGQGFVKIKKLDDVDNVGAYLTAYLGDMELSEWQNSKGGKTLWCGDVKDIEIVDDTGTKQNKKYLKGARLSMYPPNFNLYRCSRGIKKPTTETMTYAQAKKKVSSAKLTFSNAVELSDDDFSNLIAKEYYNSKRK